MPAFTKLPRCTPAQAGLDPRQIIAMIDDYQARGLQINSFLLVRHGKVLAEGYYAPYAPDQLQTVYSLSKTFTSMAVGIAAGEGILSPDERVVDVFAEELAASGVTPGKELESLTLRHLLRMSTGQPQEPFGENCWADLRVAFLRQPFSEMPGEVFRYNTAATYMLSAALKKHGVDLEEYLQEKLLTPLGVSGTRWLRDSHDVCTGGFGFSLVPELIAKLGVLILNDGRWEEQQLVPREYVALATRPQIYQSLKELGMGDWNAGYGYQMWMCQNGCFRGDGMYGQLCLMDRRTDTVLAMTALVHDMQAEMNVYYDNVLVHYRPAPLPEDPQATAALEARLKELRHDRLLPGDDGAPVPPSLLRTYDTPVGSMALRMEGDRLMMHLGGSGIEAGRGRYVTTLCTPLNDTLSFRDNVDAPIQLAYGMQAGTLVLRRYEVESLEEVTIRLTPGEGGVQLQIHLTTNPAAPQPIYEATL